MLLPRMLVFTWALAVLAGGVGCRDKSADSRTPAQSPPADDFAAVPALSGPLQGLAFGMPSEKAAGIVPALKGAFTIRGKDHQRTQGAWQKVAGVELMFEFSDEHDRGLTRIVGRLPEKAARAWLEKRLGPVERPGGRFDWTFWFNKGAGTRTTLHPSREGYARIEVMPFQSLEQALADGGVFTFKGGKPLLGASLAELKATYGSSLVYLNDRPALILVKPIPYGSGYISLNVDFTDEVLDEYKFLLDYTYNPSQRAAIAAVLQSALGTGRTVNTGLGECQAYPLPGDTSTPLVGRQCQPTDYACDRPEVIVCDRGRAGITTFHIEVKRPYQD